MVFETSSLSVIVDIAWRIIWSDLLKEWWLVLFLSCWIFLTPWERSSPGIAKVCLNLCLEWSPYQRSSWFLPILHVEFPLELSFKLLNVSCFLQQSTYHPHLTTNNSDHRSAWNRQLSYLHRLYLILIIKESNRLYHCMGDCSSP